MSSKGHDFILELVHMKMKQMGYNLVASDSHYSSIKFKMPPTIIKHRPDALGYKSSDDSLCIGEAKYYGDLNSSRSHEQIKDFIDLTKDKKLNIRVIFGIPLSEKSRFMGFLNHENLELNNRTILITVPDRLIPREDKEVETT